MTKQEIAAFIDSIDWDDLLLKSEPEPEKQKEPPVKLVSNRELSIQGERERQARHTTELINREKEWAEAAKHNRVWLSEMRRIGEYHASQKQAHLEAEYWAREQERNRRSWNYDPIRLFQDEIERE